MSAELLLERLPLVTYMLRREPPSRLLYVSPQIEATFGFRPDDFTVDDFWTSRIVDEDRAAFVAALDRLRRTGERMEVEYRVAGTDGEPMWVRDIASADDELIHGYLVDITREKALERDLARERATLDAFFTESAIGLAITDGDGRYVRINDALARLNDAPAGAHIGRTHAEVAPDVAAVVDPLRAKADEAAAFHIDLERPGQTVHALLSYFPFSVGGERYHGRVVVDLTEQRRAQDAEERYRHLIEQLPLAVYVNEVEPRRRATYVSPQIEELTGYPPEAFYQQPGLGDRLIHPDDHSELEARERLSREQQTVFEHEYRIVRADGAVRWVLDRMETVVDEAGEPLYEQGFLVDVTDTHETAALLRGVWDGALDAIVIADSEGRYVDANPAACDLFGRPRGELLTLRIDDIFPAGTWDAYVASDRPSRESTFMRPDGQECTIESVSKPDVLPGLHLAVLRDVTERRRLERDLWRAQKLESVARLAGGVAHDFNNLLTAIRGYAQLLQSRVEPGSVEEHHAREIDRVADRAAALTAQLLALGRRQMLKSRPLDLNRHLETIRDALVELAGARNELVFDLEPALRAVRVDSGMLAQAIANLVANASDAMPGGGLIVVRTENAEVAGRDDLADGNYVVLSIDDSGCGLDETTLEHVFEPFFTTKDVGRGAGLGLASAYGTVKQSGGTITVESELGRGATFSIYLPEASAGDAAPARAGRGETVLVVERDPAVRDVLFELLTDASYRVLTTRTTAEAVRLAERFDGPIDLVLTDVDEERNESLLAALRVERPDVQVLTLAKPYTPERLHGAVRAALDVCPDRGSGVPVSG